MYIAKSKYIKEDVSKVSKSIRGKYCIANTYYCSDIKYDKFTIQNNINHKNDKCDSEVYRTDVFGIREKKYEWMDEVLHHPIIHTILMSTIHLLFFFNVRNNTI